MTSATDDYEDDKRMFARLEQLTTRNAELEAEVAEAAGQYEQLDRLMHANERNMQKRIAKLEDELNQLAKWVVNRGQGRPDHACSDCIGAGDMVIPGWRCGYHLSTARNALKESGL